MSEKLQTNNASGVNTPAPASGLNSSDATSLGTPSSTTKPHFPKPGRLLDPRADLVFKKVFGTNKILVKSFLNSLLPLSDDHLIETVEYLPSEQIPRTPSQKYSIVDVRCTDQRGRIFIVEMQMGWSESFKQRLQFSIAKTYADQLEKGDQYDLLNPVYGLALIGEVCEKETDEWYHHYQMTNGKTGEKIKGLEMVYVELPKFKATTPWEKRLGILWLRFLNEIGNRSDVPAEFLEIPEINYALEMVSEASYTKEELAQYDGYWDQVSIEKTIIHDAESKGREEGKAEGLAEGKAEGLVEGKAEGILENQRETARKMLLKNKYDDDDICELSGLTTAELVDLKASLS